MKFWIVWTYQKTDNLVGIYGNCKDALKKCNELNKLEPENYERTSKKDIVPVRDGLLDAEHTSYNAYRCSKLRTKNDVDGLYCLLIREILGGGQYGSGDRWLFVFEKKKSAIKESKIKFKDDHDDSCDSEEQNDNKKTFFGNLEKYDEAEFDSCGNCEYVSCKIWYEPKK